MDLLRGTHDDRLNVRPLVLAACFGWGVILGLMFMYMRSHHAAAQQSTPPPTEPSVSVVEAPLADPSLPVERPVAPAFPDVESTLLASLADGRGSLDAFDPLRPPQPMPPVIARYGGLNTRTAPLPGEHPALTAVSSTPHVTTGTGPSLRFPADSADIPPTPAVSTARSAGTDPVALPRSTGNVVMSGRPPVLDGTSRPPPLTDRTAPSSAPTRLPDPSPPLPPPAIATTPPPAPSVAPVPMPTPGSPPPPAQDDTATTPPPNLIRRLFN